MKFSTYIICLIILIYLFYLRGGLFSYIKPTFSLFLIIITYIYSPHVCILLLGLYHRPMRLSKDIFCSLPILLKKDENTNSKLISQLFNKYFHIKY